MLIEHIGAFTRSRGQMRLTTAGSEEVLPLTEARLTLDLGGFIYSGWFIVYDLAKYDVVLGKDWFEEVPHHVDLRRNILQLGWDERLRKWHYRLEGLPKGAGCSSFLRAPSISNLETNYANPTQKHEYPSDIPATTQNSTEPNRFAPHTDVDRPAPPYTPDTDSSTSEHTNIIDSASGTSDTIMLRASDIRTPPGSTQGCYGAKPKANLDTHTTDPLPITLPPTTPPIDPHTPTRSTSAYPGRPSSVQIAPQTPNLHLNSEFRNADGEPWEIEVEVAEIISEEEFNAECALLWADLFPADIDSLSASIVSQKLTDFEQRIRTEYSDLFVPPTGLPPKRKDRGFRIRTIPGVEPPHRSPYRMSPLEWDQYREERTKLLD